MYASRCEQMRHPVSGADAAAVGQGAEAERQLLCQTNSPCEAMAGCPDRLGGVGQPSSCELCRLAAGSGAAASIQRMANAALCRVLNQGNPNPTVSRSALGQGFGVPLPLNPVPMASWRPCYVRTCKYAYMHAYLDTYMAQPAECARCTLLRPGTCELASLWPKVQRVAFNSQQNAV